MSVVETPATEAELVAIVTQAAAARRPVRVGRPSRSRHRRGPEILIDLSRYQRPLHLDGDAGEATFEAGITLRRLAWVLSSWGLTTRNGGRDPAQALGAAVSVGAHGSAARLGSLATEVTGMRLVTPGGEVVVCSAAEEPEIFDAARIGLGALGVISTVTVLVELGFNLRSAASSVPLDEAIDRFDAYADGNDYVELSWLPGRDRARVMTANRSDDRPDAKAVDRCYRWWNRRRLPAPRLSYAFARHDSGRALTRARELSAGQRSALPFPIEVSVTAGDDLPLSPTQGQPSLFIAGVAGLDGRPEWGGPHGASEASLRARYPRWDEWQAVRERLDPQRCFAHNSGHG
ncbi:MAG TPA: D-arabinono-1,4-lactone oxidase [Acidimicrobiales bacterium]|nr:D-arabinono-1,4-lactone oxidase [Acidimicrobiales bacterium]